MSAPPPCSTESFTRLGGLLGRALDESLRHHLSTFIQDESSPAIALFSPERVVQNHEGDWYGEHAGKWLIAASRAVMRTGDAALRESVRRVGDYLVAQQGDDGYLGTYAPSRRFMHRQGPAPISWDGAPSQRTWDVWVHSYLVLGLLEAARALNESRYTTAACRIGDLFWRTLHDGGIPIVSLGNHHGLSATALLDPAVELHFSTGESRYLDLARLILTEIETAPALRLVEKILEGSDAAHLATGKAYQLCWNLVGLAKLYRATGDERLGRAVRLAWENIREHHLTLGGGPWGGVAHRSREVFNPQPVFSPYGYVETCSTLAWIQLNRELLLQSGESRYADEIEKSAYNDLLGAQAAGGDNWCYYSFPNGRRVHTTYWRCCKSSGPMALEELPGVAYHLSGHGAISVNLYGASEVVLPHPVAGDVRLRQSTEYPFGGSIRLTVEPTCPSTFVLQLRIPDWADSATVSINGQPTDARCRPGSYAKIERQWRRDDEILLDLPMWPRLHRQMNRNVQESRAPDGTPVAQEVLRFDYAAITRGPLVYATNLIDGFKIEETIRLPAEPNFEVLPPAPGYEGPSIRLDPGYRAPLLFHPYYEAGHRRDRSWRLTWLQLPPADLA